MRSLGKGVMSATTQVKVLSPEIISVAMGQGLHFLEASIGMHVNGECMFDMPGSESVAGKRTVYIGTWENGAADKAAIQRVKVPSCQLPDFRHVVMPHLGMGNHPGDAWCKRLGCPEHSSVVGATRGSSEYGSLNIKE